MKMYKNHINMFAAIQLERKGGVLQFKKLGVGILGIIIGINLITMVVAFSHSMINIKKIKDLNEFLSQPEVLQTIKNEEAISSKNSNYQKDLDTFKKLNQYVGGIVSFETTMYDDISMVKPQTVTIKSFSYFDNTIQIDCTTQNNNPPADYTKALEQTGLFQYVTYKGFTTSENGIVFPIICKLKAV